ncbi:FAS1-like dehydratase domain-containing protein [Streptomyces sp. NBC_00525]|uniref:FAS1-like dehydratase domain-containing protein n=1 Tax=Streptomyces sp. NBC_00525 TaxID=2903660 RepID=UPI002E8239E0|nr:MaoC family dehydratase N-terminal domain-containing protein [Streptomyces sp. NBC_00525]WUC94847.1 MaoC family dehydratase N-terminal domain-containing protein [Streptomyces sp. NBC_00525]
MDATPGTRAARPGDAVLASSPYDVEAEKIREFAAAVGETGAACHDEEAARALGHPGLLAPPTFLTVPAARVEDMLLRRAGIAPDGLVHREQRIRLYRPVRAGDVLHPVVRLRQSGPVAGRRAVTVTTEFRDAEGAPVGVLDATLLLPADARPARGHRHGTDTEAQEELE